MNLAKTGKDVIELIKREYIDIVDLRFIDFPGIKQHFFNPGIQF